MTCFKIIMNCAIVVLLVLMTVLIALNTFVLQTFLNKGILNNTTSSNQEVLEDSNETENVEDVSLPSVKPTFDKAESTDPNLTGPEQTKTESIETKPAENKNIVYQDANVVITYLRSEESDFGPVYKFEVANTGNRAFTVQFSDVYVNGYRMALSGLYCENLQPETKAIDDFILLTNEWEDITDSPSEVKFTVVLVNPDTYLNLFESDRITFKV